MLMHAVKGSYICLGFLKLDRTLGRVMVDQACLIAGYDMVSRLHTRDTFSHALNNACCLMPEDAGEEALWVCRKRESNKGDGLCYPHRAL